MERPKNVGICGIEVYFPKCCVSQETLGMLFERLLLFSLCVNIEKVIALVPSNQFPSHLCMRICPAGRFCSKVGLKMVPASILVTETYDGVSAGKYTVGLGQTHMGFCIDAEDVCSIALTVVDRLMKRYNVSPSDIGRLEVGTESAMDNSKAVKTVLMQLFEGSGNHDIEGTECKNACYGGTQAFFNTAAWVESSAWDGRYGIVVCADIAVYAKGNARPTGGAGGVALLIGPNAPIVLEPVRSSHFENTWDFCKPVIGSEFPVVDGQLSAQCYMRALDKCYETYTARLMAHDQSVDRGLLDRPPACKRQRIEEQFTAAEECIGTQAGSRYTLDDFPYICLHCPYTKLVRKGFARLLCNDYIYKPHMDKFRTVPNDFTTDVEAITNEKQVSQLFQHIGADEFQDKIQPSLLLAVNVGNLYTGSLYACLASLISTQGGARLEGKRCLMFSYGSGFASTMFGLVFNSPEHPVYATMSDLKDRLEARRWVSPETFDDAMRERERTHGLAPHVSTHVATNALDVWLAGGTFYCSDVDARHIHTYKFYDKETQLT